MMEVGGNELGKCPPPVVPATIVLEKDYPWFPVVVGKLAEPWGITGELLFANEFVTVLRTAPREIVVARDLWSLRGVGRYTNVDEPEIYFHKGDLPWTKSCGGGCTIIKFFCPRPFNPDLPSFVSATPHYRSNNVLPSVLWVRYKEEINLSDC
jgi:hypothetical protein